MLYFEGNNLPWVFETTNVFESNVSETRENTFHTIIENNTRTLTSMQLCKSLSFMDKPEL